ncbi:MAG TPA: PepSY domain-containing protein [Gemmataceae bacterium]|nr:PepSY domain-containing protein [Gemmataceae bacterium]
MLKRFLQLVRRTHLYAGLLMLPWSILYGVTAFLFNHPTVFSDQPYVTFDRAALADTPMATPPAPSELAQQVVEALNSRAKPGSNYALVEPDKARYTRDFAFAVVRRDNQEINVLIDPTGAGGSVRSGEVVPPKVEAPAPFAIGPAPPTGPRANGPVRTASLDGLKLESPLHERIKAAVPTILERTGFPTGEAEVTSVPDLAFLMEADGQRWRVTYNAMTGALSGRLATDEPPSTPSTTRNFLLRLHSAHGYPYEHGSRWIWAGIVDVMAIVLVFWGLSGLVMWWQLRALRRSGSIVLALSTGAAVAIAIGMRAAMAT